MLWDIYFYNSSLNGWVTDEGPFGGMLAEMIATTIHVNNIGSTHISLIIERTIILRMCHLFGFLGKGDGGGIIVSGTSLAIVICMAVTRKRLAVNVKQNEWTYGS